MQMKALLPKLDVPVLTIQTGHTGRASITSMAMEPLEVRMLVARSNRHRLLQNATSWWRRRYSREDESPPLPLPESPQ
jgi:hypothetical protein